LSSINIVLFSIFILIVATYIILDLVKHEILSFIELKILIVLGLAFIFIVVSLWIYIMILRYRIDNSSFNDHQIQVRLDKIGQLLGRKTESILRSVICK